MNRRAELIKAIEDVLIPRCRIPGCCFRGVTCPVHDLEEKTEQQVQDRGARLGVNWSDLMKAERGGGRR